MRTATKKSLLFTVRERRVHTPPCKVTWGRHEGQPGGRRREGKYGQEALLWFLQEGMGRGRGNVEGGKQAQG